MARTGDSERLPKRAGHGRGGGHGRRRSVCPDAFLHALTDPGAEVAIRHCSRAVHPPRWRGRRERLEEHLLVCVARGALRARLGTAEVTLPAGTVAWIPPGTEKWLGAAEGARGERSWRLRFAVRRKGERLRVRDAPEIRTDAAALEPVLSLLREALADGRLAAERRPLLAACMARFLALPAPGEEATRRLDAVRRRRVERLVERSLPERIRPAELAAAAGLSPEYFAKLFRATYGRSPRRYLLEARMNLAGEMLHDSAMSIKEIAAELGEADVGTFCRLFKRVTGRTPGRYRAGAGE